MKEIKILLLIVSLIGVTQNIFSQAVTKLTGDTILASANGLQCCEVPAHPGIEFRLRSLSRHVLKGALIDKDGEGLTEFEPITLTSINDSTLRFCIGDSCKNVTVIGGSILASECALGIDTAYKPNDSTIRFCRPDACWDIPIGTGVAISSGALTWDETMRNSPDISQDYFSHFNSTTWTMDSILQLNIHVTNWVDIIGDKDAGREDMLKMHVNDAGKSVMSFSNSTIVDGAYSGLIVFYRDPRGVASDNGSGSVRAVVDTLMDYAGATTPAFGYIATVTHDADHPNAPPLYDVQYRPLYGFGNATFYSLLGLASGQIRLPKYVLGAFSGTAAYGLGVDDSGNVIVTTTGGGITSESDPIALAKTITENVGYGLTRTGAATQTIGSNPSYTFEIDSFAYATRAWRQKGIDSVVNLINSVSPWNRTAITGQSATTNITKTVQLYDTVAAYPGNTRIYTSNKPKAGFNVGCTTYISGTLTLDSTSRQLQLSTGYFIKTDGVHSMDFIGAGAQGYTFDGGTTATTVGSSQGFFTNGSANTNLVLSAAGTTRGTTISGETLPSINRDLVTGIQYRVLIGAGSTALTLDAGGSYVNTFIGYQHPSATITEAASGIHKWIVSAAIATMRITNGAASTTNIAGLYVNSPSGITGTNGNFSMAADTGQIYSGDGMRFANAHTVPSSSPAGQVQLYAESVSSSSELRVRDEAGNITTLSPHNAMGLPNGLPDKHWTYHSEKNGNYITVDEYRVAELLEIITGEKLIYTGKTKDLK